MEPDLYEGNGNGDQAGPLKRDEMNYINSPQDQGKH